MKLIEHVNNEIKWANESLAHFKKRNKVDTRDYNWMLGYLSAMKDIKKKIEES